jgi:hypothetical protein
MDFLSLHPGAPYTVRLSAFFALDTISEMDYYDDVGATEP